MDRSSLFKISGLPDSFGALLLVFSFILLLAPYFSGADFGLFKIPIFSTEAKKWLKVIGPFLFISCVLSFAPFFPANNQNSNINIAKAPSSQTSTSATPYPSLVNPSPSLTPSANMPDTLNTEPSNSPIPIRYWVKSLPEVPGDDANKLLSNALGSWQSVVATPIRRADSEAQANVIIVTAGDDPALAQLGPPRSKRSRLIITFGSTVQWTPRTFEAASCRMLGHILGLPETSTPGQLMTSGAQPETLPLTPQAEDIRRVREIWDR